jgi:ribonuclease P protein component
VLPKENRLHNHEEIEQLKATGRLFQFSHFGLLFIKRPDQSPSRFCFLVSTKVSKKACQRNLTKRRLSEAVKSNLLQMKSSFSVIVLAKKSLLEIELNEIKTEIINAFQKISLL